MDRVVQDKLHVVRFEKDVPVAEEDIHIAHFDRSISCKHQGQSCATAITLKKTNLVIRHRIKILRVGAAALVGIRIAHSLYGDRLSLDLPLFDIFCSN